MQECAEENPWAILKDCGKKTYKASELPFSRLLILGQVGTCLMQCRKVQNTYNLLRNRGRNAYKANKLMSSKIVSLEQHLDYEAIIQIAEIDDQELNFDNQALGKHCYADRCPFFWLRSSLL